jgi:hypothetical protein
MITQFRCPILSEIDLQFEMRRTLSEKSNGKSRSFFKTFIEPAAAH